MEKAPRREGVVNEGREYRWVRVTVAILGVLLALAVLLIIRQGVILRRAHLMDQRAALSGFVAKHGPLTADETGVIGPWMTFDYVNALFDLPPDFLKTTFRIQDPSYPKLTLARYASTEGYQESEFMDSLRAAVANYLRQSR